jgi:hypothetical protein
MTDPPALTRQHPLAAVLGSDRQKMATGQFEFPLLSRVCNVLGLMAFVQFHRITMARKLAVTLDGMIKNGQPFQRLARSSACWDVKQRHGNLTSIILVRKRPRYPCRIVGWSIPIASGRSVRVYCRNTLKDLFRETQDTAAGPDRENHLLQAAERSKRNATLPGNRAGSKGDWTTGAGSR